MRSSLKCVVQVQHELTVIYTMPTNDTPAVFKNTSARCFIVMSVHITYQYLSECGAVKYPRLVIKQRHEMCFDAFIDCHLQWATAVVMLPVLALSDSK